MTNLSAVEAVFFAALDRPDPADRAAFLDRACRGDPDLRAHVDRLLAAHPGLGRFLEPGDTPPDAPTAGYAPAGAAADAPGAVLAGRYKLVEVIGEGGMGAVWMAQQTAPVKRLVAVKLVKPGMDSKVVLARFEAERQALALMDHPNIAKVLDAGAAPDGRPYFVMELVKGVPVTRFCDARKLTPRQRLDLFLPVCRAVQHAHMKGVIHRDLKPSNVLVALYDGKPVPKVIDFGIAKAAGQPLTERTLVTGFGAVVGTPEYMSPEQATLNQLDVDTRTDVYSLGVILYELLAGSPPIPRPELEKVGLLEVLRAVREVDPPSPSTRLSTSDRLAALAADRGTTPRDLAGVVRGELDWVVMRALEKDRDRRYESAGAFAADVERFLADEPVAARPASGWYRMRKFARRNRAVLMTAGLVAAALVAGTAVSTWQAVEADAARRLADERLGSERQASAQAQASFRKALEAVDRMMVEVSGLKVASPQLHELRRRLNEDSVAFYTELAALNPRDAEVFVRRGRVLRGLGKLDQARGDFVRAIELDPENAEAHHSLGGLLIDSGPALGVANGGEVGLAHVQRAVELQPTKPVRHAELGWAYCLVGRNTDAAASLRRAAELCGPASGEGFFYLGEADRSLGNTQASLANYEKCLANGPSDPWVNNYIALAHHQLVGCYLARGENERAWASLEKVIALPGPPDIRAMNYFYRGEVYLSQGRYEDALSDFSNVIEFNPTHAFVHKRRAWLHFRSGRYPQALADVAKAVELKPDDTSALTWIPPGAVAACPDEGFRKGILDLADRTIERLRGLPAEASAYAARAILHAALKADAKARDDMEKAIRLNPKSASTYNGVAWRLATGPDVVRDGQRAVEYATRACELSEWKKPTMIDTLAAAYAEVGDFDKAVEYQMRALSDPTFADNEGARQRLDLYAKKTPYRDTGPVLPELAPPPRPANSS